ncbi:MAG: peptidase M20 [Burkholderiales bacterium]|jgi:acetylornithine deacetylase/succinyl-diaminopimelate desuccinylase-like protein|nr:peptidase M20 [Burkholderiales bacterium]
MKMQLKILTAGLLCAWSSIGLAQPLQPDPNPVMDAYITAVESDPAVQAVIRQYMAEEEDRFKEHMEITRIASPSRQEYYRAIEMYRRLKTFGFADDELVSTALNNSGVMPGAAVQQVDGLKVYQTCAIVQGSWSGATDGTGGIYARPKVVLEGHIDTVNPSQIPDFNPDAKPDPYYYEPVKLQPYWDAAANKATVLVETPAELKALPDALSFDANGRIIDDASYQKAVQRYANTALANSAAQRIYVPGYSDAIGNTIGVYWLAKMFKANHVKPVYDVWFCFTAGEEGRGNLAGMKQLYGYNQDHAAIDPADNGKNKLNIVANISIDGGSGTFNFLGSYRYEVNYKGGNKNAGAREAARRIAKIADVKSPREEGATTDNTTYTVGIAYPKDDGSTSFEIDMRSPQVPSLNMLKDKLYPIFGVGDTTANGVKIQQLWYGDRPAHVHPESLATTDPMIYANWKIRCGTNCGNSFLSTSSSSLNDNIPAAMNIPTLNLNLHSTAAGGGGHAFNEWGIRGSLVNDQTNVERVLTLLLVVAGLNDGNGAEIVPPAYPALAPKHDNTVWDQENIWTK